MSGVDAHGPRTANAPGEDHARAQELLKGWIDRAEGLAHGHGELPQGELPPGVRTEEPEDSHLGLGAQKILEHVSDTVPGLYRFSDYTYDFPKHPTAGESPSRRHATASDYPPSASSSTPSKAFRFRLHRPSTTTFRRILEIGRRQLEPLGRVVVHDTHIGMSESALEGGPRRPSPLQAA